MVILIAAQRNIDARHTGDFGKTIAFEMMDRLDQRLILQPVQRGQKGFELQPHIAHCLALHNDAVARIAGGLNGTGWGRCR